MILINLLPPELRRRETAKIVLPEIPIKKTLITVGLGLVALQILLSLITMGASARASMMRHEIASLTGQLQETKKIKSQTLSALNKLQEIRSLTAKKFYWASILNALTNSITKGVWLRSLSLGEVVIAPRTPPPSAKKTEETFQKKKEAPQKKEPPPQIIKTIKLEGSVYAAGQETAFIGKFIKALKENEYFQGLFSDIELSNTNQRKISEYDVFDFVLLCKFKKDKI